MNYNILWSDPQVGDQVGDPGKAGTTTLTDDRGESIEATHGNVLDVLQQAVDAGMDIDNVDWLVHPGTGGSAQRVVGWGDKRELVRVVVGPDGKIVSVDRTPVAESGGVPPETLVADLAVEEGQ